MTWPLSKILHHLGIFYGLVNDISLSFIFCSTKVFPTLYPALELGVQENISRREKCTNDKGY